MSRYWDQWDREDLDSWQGCDWEEDEEQETEKVEYDK